MINDIPLDEIQTSLRGKTYAVVPYSGDPFIRPARARLIWANNTAQAVHNLGVSATLIGSTHGLPQKFEKKGGQTSLRRLIGSLYNVPATYHLHGTYDLPGRYGELSPRKWALNYDLPRYVLPYCSILHTRDPELVERALEVGVEVVYEDHDEDHNLGFDALPQLIEKYPNFRVIIAITEAVKTRLVSSDVPDERILVLDSGFNEASLKRDFETHEKLRKQSLHGRERLVVYAGGLHEERGIDHLLNAAEEMMDTQFVLCGGNEGDCAFWRKKLREKGVANVRLPGYVRQKEALLLQQAADAVVLTRRHDPRAEITSPLKYFEYLASGTPVVAARIPVVEQHSAQHLAVTGYDAQYPETLVRALRQSFVAYPRKPDGYAENQAFAQQFTWEERQKHIFRHLLKH